MSAEKTIGDRIREERERLGLSQAKLAKKADTSQQTVDRLEKGITTFSRDLPAILSALGLKSDNPAHQAPIEARPSTTVIPIYATEAGDRNSKQIKTDVIVGSFTRPAILEGVPGVYGIYQHGYDMAPLYRPGDILIADPYRPVGVDSGGIFYGADMKSYTVAELIKSTAEAWTVKRWGDSPKEETLNKVDFPRAHCIVIVVKKN